jgi:predicted ester cyclase
MQAEEIKTKAKRVVEACNKGNLDVLDEVYATNVVVHRPPLADSEGIEALKQYHTDLRTAFPDIKMTIEEIIVEGDRNAVRLTTRGTHTGQMPDIPIPPTGKQMVITGCFVGHWVGGKCVEQWDYSDLLGLLQQLGVVPPMGEGGG